MKKTRIFKDSKLTFFSSKTVSNDKYYIILLPNDIDIANEILFTTSIERNLLHRLF